MPNTREKLIELLMQCFPDNVKLEMSGNKMTATIKQGVIADHLIANGVTISKTETVAYNLSPTAEDFSVVRCQNCTHHDTEDCPPNRVWCKHLKRRMKPEGYCSYGKPKQNKQQAITEETMIALHKLGEQSHENSRDTTV